MLFTFIENIRKQSKEVRRSYAVFITVGITLVIVCTYFLVMYFGALGTRPWDGGEDESKKDTSASDLFNASNVFFEGGAEEQSRTGESWSDQLQKMNEQFMEERLLES